MGEPWYGPLIGLFAALDFFVFFIPVDLLLITRFLFRHEGWIKTVFLVASGSALGAFILAALIQSDMTWVVKLSNHHGHVSHEWVRISDFLHRHGTLGILVSTVTFIPLPITVAVAAWERISMVSIVFSVFVGRAVKYFVYGIIAVYFPHIAHKMVSKSYKPIPKP